MGRVLALQTFRRTGTIHLCDDSLIASGIYANFLAVVDFLNAPANGDLAAVLVAGVLLVRYYWQTDNGCIHLAPANPAYSVKCVPETEVYVIGRILDAFPVKACQTASISSK